MVLDFERRKSKVWTLDGNMVSPDQRTPEERHELAIPDDVTEYRHVDLNICGLTGVETPRACTIAIEEEDLVHTTSCLVLMTSWSAGGRKRRFLERQDNSPTSNLSMNS